MSCNIVRDKNNQILDVLTQEGKESKLFKTISKHPLIADSESALSLYKNIYSNKLEAISEDSMTLKHRIGTTLVNSYKEALETAQQNQEIEVGIEADGKFYSLLSVDKSIDKNSTIGFIQNGILQNIIAEEKVKIGNEYLLQAFGQSDIRKHTSMEMIRVNAIQNLGIDSIYSSGDTFTLSKTNDKVELYTKSGKPETLTKEEFDNLSYEQLRNKYDEYENIIAEREYNKNVPLFRESTLPTNQIELKKEDDLKLGLLSLLNKMGVKIIPISNYVEKFNVKNGIDPSAKALADIANRIVAVNENSADLNSLTEETIHFINEAIPQEKLENILRNIDKSEEWKEFSDTYRKIYSQEYKGQELEDVIRKEILGKVALNAVNQNRAVSETQQNFFNAAIQFITDFFRNISLYIKEDYVKELDQYLNDIQDIIDNEDISNLNLYNFSTVNRRYYDATGKSTIDRIVAETTKQIDILERQNNDLSRDQKGSELDRINLKNSRKELDNKLEYHAVAKTVQIVDNNVNLIKAAYEDSSRNKKKYDLSTYESIIYKNLTVEIKDGLAVIKQLIDKDDSLDNRRAWDTLSKQIDKVLQGIEEIKAERSINQSEAFERQVDAVTIDRGLSQKEKEAMMRWAVAAENEIGWVSSTFGTLNNSTDSLMSLFATIKTGMLSEGSRKDHNQIKEFQKVIYDNGYDEKIVSTFVKDGYFISERDIPAYLKKLDDNFISEYRKVFDKDKTRDEEILQKRQKGTLTWTDEQKDLINNKTNELNQLESERRMTSEYYEGLEKKYKDLDISETTQKVLGALNADRRKITEKARNTDGKIDLSLLNAQDLKLLELRNLDRKQYKSFVDETGELKQGLDYSEDVEGKVIIVPTVPLEELSIESRIALDIYKLDNSYEKSDNVGKNKNTISQSFMDLFKGQRREDQVKSLFLNAQIRFSDEFWGGFGQSQNLISKLEELDQTEEVKESISKLKEINFKSKNLIKAYTKTNNPSETDVENMSDLTKYSIKKIQEDLEVEREKAKKLTKDVTIQTSEEGDLIEGVSGTNEAWSKRLKDLNIINNGSIGIDDSYTISLLEEAKKHMTERNKKAVQETQYAVDSYIQGKTLSIPKSLERFLEDKGLRKKDLRERFVRSRVLIEFAENRLLSYYKRYTPQGYVEFQNDINNEEVAISTILNKNYEFVEVVPNYSFQDEDLAQVNPKYIVNSGMGVLQPKAEKYQNEEFKKLFGEITRDKNGDYLKSTKNEKLFNVYKATIKFRKDQIQMMEGGQSYNIYMTPQIRKQGIERYLGGVKSLSKQSVKDAFENLTTYTEDDQIQGDQRLGTANKVIPKPFFSRLENQSDITEDIFSGLAVTNKAANLYAMRVKYFGNAMAIMDKAATRSNPNGKEATATNRFKMLDSAMDNDFFGIKQVTTASVDVPFFGKQDGAKTVETLGKFLRFKGLGGSIIIPATAYLTAKTKQTVERIVGQYINKDSFSKGSSKYHQLVGKAMSEINSLRTTSELNAVGQYWGAFELENSLYGSKFSALPRFLGKSSMMLYQAANYPLYGKGMLTVLHDFRVVNGKILKFTDFQRIQRMENTRITNEEVKVNWAKEKQYIYDLQVIKEDGSVEFNKEKLKELLTNIEGEKFSDEELEEEILRVSNDIRIQIKNLNVKIDMQLDTSDKVAANRHFLLNFLMMFKGFMVVLAEERFKGQGFNTQSRQLESGSYSGIYRMVGDIVKEWQKNGGSFMEAFKNQYYGNFEVQESRIKELEQVKDKSTEQLKELQNLKEEVVQGIELSELRKQNLKRLGIDLLFVNSLMVIMMLIRSYADDDEDKSNYPLQLANLLTSRLVSEVHSANLGIVSQYWETAKEPLQAFDQILSLGKLLEAKSWEEGSGMKSAGKFLPFFNSLNQLIDPATAEQNRRFYNEVQDNSFMSVPLYHFMSKEK